MTICPKCNAKNRPEAAFCSNCGTILLTQTGQAKPVQPQSTPVETKPTVSKSVTQPPCVPGMPVPLQDEATATELSSPEPTLEEQKTEKPPIYVTVPVARAGEATPPTGFIPRPEGSIFNGSFQYDSLAFQDEHLIRYLVTEVHEPEAPYVSICTNPSCLTVHTPGEPGQEKYCTQCGHELERSPMLLLEEADRDQFSVLNQVIELRLAHPNIHPPIAIFQEEVGGSPRYCQVIPYSQELPSAPEISEALEWGLQLASGLDYLHSHGIAFGEELDPSSIGYNQGKPVWRNFKDVRVLALLADREKINNVRMLALCLYTWITGRATYSPDTSLNPTLNRLFYQALVDEGFTSAMDLAEQIELTIKGGLSPFNLDYQVGRRTHVGKEREENEDSLLSLTHSTVQLGASLPVGLFAVADGMGGHATGDLASGLAIQTVAEEAPARLHSIHKQNSGENITWLRQLIQAANSSVYESRMKVENDMGTTMVCALLYSNQAAIANVGDSRAYLIRDGSIQQLTTDHSMVQQMVSIGQITPEEARTHPQRNVITRSLGEKQQVEADIYTQTLLPGDKLLLCSDGLNGMLDDQKIKLLVQESASPQVACDYLVDAANLEGGEDNISVIVVEVFLA